MAESIYYVVNYADKQYKTADISNLKEAIIEGLGIANIETVRGQSVMLAVGHVPISIEKRTKQMDDAANRVRVIR